MNLLEDCLDWSEDFNKALVIETDKTRKSFQSDLNLCNPYSKASCLILYLYTMELADPPLYEVLNKGMRMKDYTHLPTLGPYAYALGWVTTNAEQGRAKADKIPSYEDSLLSQVDNPLGRLCASFLLFRGGPILP